MEPTESGEPQKRGRGRPKGSRNRATIEREEMEAEITGLLVPDIEEVPEPEPEPTPEPRHVLDVSFESDEILGEPKRKRASRKRAVLEIEAPAPAPVVPETPRPKRAVRIKRPKAEAPEAPEAPTPTRSDPERSDVYGLIKRELAARRRASRDARVAEYDSYFAR